MGVRPRTLEACKHKVLLRNKQDAHSIPVIATTDFHAELVLFSVGTIGNAPPEATHVARQMQASMPRVLGRSLLMANDGMGHGSPITSQLRTPTIKP